MLSLSLTNKGRKALGNKPKELILKNFSPPKTHCLSIRIKIFIKTSKKDIIKIKKFPDFKNENEAHEFLYEFGLLEIKILEIEKVIPGLDLSFKCKNDVHFTVFRKDKKVLIRGENFNEKVRKAESSGVKLHAEVEFI